MCLTGFIYRNKKLGVIKVAAIMIEFLLAALLLFVLFNSMLHTQAEPPFVNIIVKIQDGEISGRESVTPTGKSFYRFQGIPFAASPVGDLRFADPQPPQKWSGVRNCEDRNVVCIQLREYLSELESEDCLVLNVYTPQLPGGEINPCLAVMVYFYGGGFYIGNSTYNAYGPEFFMEHDVVIVTVNYRLGVFGYLSTEDAVIPGNFGLKDQQLALKWIKNNIKVFGGDPSMVTIFGNSAGSASVGYQILNEKSKGLFRAAIMSSGSPLNAWSLRSNPQRISYLTAKFLNASTTFGTSKELLAFMRKFSAIDLRKASLQVKNLDLGELDQALNGYYYAPVVDNYRNDSFLRDYPYEIVQEGNYSHVPLMIGINSEEAMTLAQELEFLKYVLKKIDSNKEMMVNRPYSKATTQMKTFLGGLIHDIYVENSTLEDNPGKGIRYFSDIFLNNGVLKFASLESRFTDVFLYQFSYDGEMGNFTTKMKDAEYVTHTEDMNYIWRRNIPTANNMNLRDFPESDRLVQKRLLKLYTNFAKYLNPTPGKESLLQNVTWSNLSSNNDNLSGYMDININLEMKTNLKNDTYSIWDDLFQKYALKPRETF